MLSLSILNNNMSTDSSQYSTILLLDFSATHTDPLEATATPTGRFNPPIEWIYLPLGLKIERELPL